MLSFGKPDGVLNSTADVTSQGLTSRGDHGGGGALTCDIIVDLETTDFYHLQQQRGS